MPTLTLEKVDDFSAKILVNGIPIPGIEVDILAPISSEGGVFLLQEYLPLYEVKIKDYFEHFHIFQMKFDSWDRSGDFSLIEIRGGEFGFVDLRFSVDVIEWNLPFTIREVFNALVLEPVKVKDSILKWEIEKNYNYVTLHVFVANTEEKLGYLVNHAKEVGRQAFKQTLQTLSMQLEPNSIVSLFSFPPEVRVSCEQYLLYFVKFLRDVGIEVTAKLDEQAGKTLFAVTPVNKEDALKKIGIALDIYLHLPSSPAANLNLPLLSDIEIQQLAANIQHLQGQLLLARATMQSQSAMIQAKDGMIEQQQKLIDHQLQTGTILLDSLISERQQRPASILTDSKKETKEESEEIVRGALSVQKWEWEMFEVDFPNLIRRLKAWFKERNAAE